MNIFAPVIALVTFSVSGSTETGPLQRSYSTYVNKTWEMLDDVRVEKKGQLERYLAMVNERAHAIVNDTLMGDFFRIKREFYRLTKVAPPPPGLVQKIGHLKGLVEERYLEKYLLFYDILFIDVNGDVFFTVRKQADYHRNIFSGDLAKTTLAKRLRDQAKTSFVDYSYYAASGEPSAFIIEPFFDNGNLIGWFVLQNAINKINTMFSCGRELGATGEVFLVNKMHAMLTDSRFLPRSTVLKQHLPAKNIEEKFRERRGHKSVIDYRGYCALSSFEVVPVSGSEWLLIAKIDEDEVLTGYYNQNHDRLMGDLLRNTDACRAPGNVTFPETRECVTVDMDEFRRGDGTDCLFTGGVSTCTAIVISLPGRFSYLAHVSPYDRVYGGDETDLLAHMLKKINHLEIYPFEKRHLRVTVISTVTGGFSGIVRFLTSEGLFLSQMMMLSNGAMNYANIYHDCSGGLTVAQWVPRRNGAARVAEKIDMTCTLGASLQKRLSGGGTTAGIR